MEAPHALAPDAEDAAGWTPFTHAAAAGHLGFLSALAASGVPRPTVRPAAWLR